MPSKSYWQAMYVGSDSAKEAVKSWFDPMCEGMTPYKAEVLCDKATDREKKIRAFMANADGKHFKFERTRGGRRFSISMTPIPAPAVDPGPTGPACAKAVA